MKDALSPGRPPVSNHFVNRILRSGQGYIDTALRNRGQRVAFVVAALICFAVSVAFNVFEWLSGTPWHAAVDFAYQLVVVAGFVLVWFLLSYFLKQRPIGPLKTFWTTLLLALLAAAVIRLMIGITAAENVEGSSALLGFEYETGVPLTFATVVKMHVVSSLRALLAFYLLLRLQDLVLFKRTKQSQRNWYLMLIFMVAYALLSIVKDPAEDPGVLQLVAIMPAVILMILNAFRVSWIVFLSFRAKVAGVGFSILLILLLFGLLATNGILPAHFMYIRHASYPLEQFTLAALTFGLLYCVTSFLFLIFHLPTTGDFRRKAGEITAMYSLTNLINQAFDPDKLHLAITKTPVDTGTAQMAWLAIADERSGSLRPQVVAAWKTPTQDIETMVDVAALYEELATRREPVILDEAPADRRIRRKPGDPIGTILMTPLITRDRLLGGLFVAKDVVQGFEQDDVESISVYAAQAAIALDNARLFEEQLERERLSRELDIAREVQQRLLPHDLPKMEGLAVAASSIPAYEVGGDYYDFLKLDEARLAFIIADVSGKGTSAAFYMAELQGIFRATARMAPSPADFLEQANLALSSTLERHVFVSVIYGVIDVCKEELVLARAGHCPVILVSREGTGRFIRPQGLGLGLDRSRRFRDVLEEEHISLRPGDIVTVYTDGVVESRDSQGTEYGYERLLEALKTHRKKEASAMHEALLSDLHDYLGRTEYDDDMTLMVLKWDGTQTNTNSPAT